VLSGYKKVNDALEVGGEFVYKNDGTFGANFGVGKKIGKDLLVKGKADLEGRINLGVRKEVSSAVTL